MDISSFINSIRDEILDIGEYSDITAVGSAIQDYRVAIACLKDVTNKSGVESFFKCPKSIELASLFLGTNSTFIRDEKNKRWINNQILNWRKWLPDEKLDGIVAGLLLSKAQQSRGRRRRKKFSGIVERNLLTSLKNIDAPLLLEKNPRLGLRETSRKFDYIIRYEDHPLLAIIIIYQSSSGGRQQDIFLGLPDLQISLARSRISLLVVADGPGFLDMVGVVEKAGPRLDNLTNLQGLEDGQIDKAIVNAINIYEGKVEYEIIPDDALSRLTTQVLKSGNVVSSNLINIPDHYAADFFLRYESSHPKYELINLDGNQLAPVALDQIRVIRSLINKETFDKDDGVDSIISILEKLGFHTKKLEETNSYMLLGIENDEIQLRLPSPLPLFITPPSSPISRHELFTIIDRSLSGGRLISRVALLVDLFEYGKSREIANSLKEDNKSQVSVLGEHELIEILLLRPGVAKEYFSQLILRDIDLTIVSPFISEGPTPHNMFYGRDLEIRRIIENIEDQSFALIGGRKSGKTSLLRRLLDILPSKTNVSYIDCQAHPDRKGFLAYLNTKTKEKYRIEDPSDISNAEIVIDAFLKSEFGDAFGVLLLDEVDELFFSDSHSNQYPHVLSRALRSISQSSRATITVTGERELFELTTAPSSPHWNFCTPIYIGPLAREPGYSLLRDPLSNLGISISSDALDQVAITTALHPNLIQFLGTKIVEGLVPYSRSGAQLLVGVEEIRLITDSPEFRNRFAVTFYSQSRSIEKLISIELSYDNAVDSEEIFESLLRQDITITIDDVLRGLSFLQLYYIAEQRNEGYAYSSEAFEILLKPLATKLIIDHWKDGVK